MLMGVTRTVLLFAICLIQLFVTVADGTSEATGAVVAGRVSTSGVTSRPHAEQAPPIQWFKKELRISPKYVEKRQGVFGLSWAHFLTMVFLVIFFVLGLAALVIRYRRTRELIKLLLEDKEHENKS